MTRSGQRATEPCPRPFLERYVTQVEDSLERHTMMTFVDRETTDDR